MSADNAAIQEAAASIRRLGVSPVDVLRLAAATPADQIRHKPGPHSKYCEKPCQVAHKPLDYVDARYVMRFLDDVVGPENWQSRHTMEGDKVQCSIGIRIDGRWVWKSDGAGETDIEGEKGSFSDALKRAAVSWGIARDLYPEPTQSVAPSRARSADEGRGSPPRPSPAPDVFGNECPDHHQPWTLKPAGVSKRTGKAYAAFYACDGKTNGAYCSRKPSEAWIDAQENH